MQQNGTSTATITWINTTSSWNTTVAYNGTWTGSIAGLNSNLGDGSVSVSIVTRDWFGNQKTVTSSGWNLNTTMVRTTFSLDTSHPDVNNVGNYVGDFVRFIATPPVGGSFTMTAQTDAGGLVVTAHQKTPHKPGPTVPAPKRITHQDNSGSTSQQRMHTDERLSMFTHSPSMTKSRQRQPSQQQERRQSSTAAPISAQMDVSHWLISSMLEASVSILLNVSGMQTHRRIPIPQQHH